MTFKGINFRQSATHPSATDSADDTYWHKAGGENYPTATRGAFTGGFGEKAGGLDWANGADRSGSGVDARLAGIVSSAGAAGNTIFLVALPNGAGTYNVRMAAGDRLAARSGMQLRIRDGDGGTSLHFPSAFTTTALDTFADINGTVHTAANWPANNTTVTLTFASSVAAFEFGSDFYLTHIAFELVGPTGPTIGTHPSNQTVTAPATATFTVAATASGGGALSYQWQRSTNGGGSWANVTTGTGGTTNSYTTAATTVSGGNANNADQWRCVVTETGGTNAGTANSNAATLTVNAAASGPTINTQPTNQTVTAPATASFSVTATTSGGALSYQWQRSTNGGGSWANVTTGTGATTANYTTAATSVSGGNANNADQYRCAVTDSNGTTNSNAATLTVNAPPAGITSSPLTSNAGVLHLSAPFEAFVLNVSTGALVVRKTSLTSHASTGVVTFTDASLSAATQYRVVWRRTDTGAQGVELLTAA